MYIYIYTPNNIVVLATNMGGSSAHGMLNHPLEVNVVPKLHLCWLSHDRYKYYEIYCYTTGIDQLS